MSRMDGKKDLVKFSIALFLFAVMVFGVMFPTFVDAVSYAISSGGETAKASRTFNFTGVTYDAEILTITYGATQEVYEFDTEGNYTYIQVNVSADNSASASASALASAINSHSTLVDASASGTQITLTAKNKGSYGNNIRVEYNVTNLEVV